MISGPESVGRIELLCNLRSINKSDVIVMAGAELSSFRNWWIVAQLPGIAGGVVTPINAVGRPSQISAADGWSVRGALMMHCGVSQGAMRRSSVNLV